MLKGLVIRVSSVSSQLEPGGQIIKGIKFNTTLTLPTLSKYSRLSLVLSDGKSRQTNPCLAANLRAMFTPDVFLFIFVLLVQLFESSTQNVSSKLIELKARPYLTSINSKFGPEIEGLSVNPDGEIYSTNFGDENTTNTLGQIFPRQRLFYTDNLDTTKLNGMEFLNGKTALTVDPNNSRLLRLDINCKGQVIRSLVLCADPMKIPTNDLTISFKTGFIYLSAMNWVNTASNTDGEIWVCHTDGRTAKRLEVMGPVNGIELSPDERTLYATESFTRNWTNVAQKIWKYDVDFKTGGIRNKRLFVDFANVPEDSVRFALDGLKADADGNLLTTRYLGSRIAVFNEDGKLTTRIALNFQNPTNLEIGMNNTLFICGQCNDAPKGCVDVVEWPPAGRS